MIRVTGHNVFLKQLLGMLFLFISLHGYVNQLLKMKQMNLRAQRLL